MRTAITSDDSVWEKEHAWLPRERIAKMSENGPTPPVSESPQNTFSFSREDFLKFVELDLWNRFQERLWKLAGGFLTVAALAGVFGVPYYINSQLEARLRTSERDFASKREAILSQAKAIALLNIAYQTQLTDFHAEVCNLYFALLGSQEKDTARK